MLCFLDDGIGMDPSKFNFTVLLENSLQVTLYFVIGSALMLSFLIMCILCVKNHAKTFSCVR